MAELEKIGMQGPSHIRDSLTSSDDPVETIREFQIHNSIPLDTLDPALRLLDLQEIRRFEFHHLVLEELQKKLLSKIGEDVHAVRKLEQLLDKCFPLVNIPLIRPIVLAVLKSVPTVPKRYLDAILADPTLYAQADIEVKRQIWDTDIDHFLTEVNQVLATYIAEKDQLLNSVEFTQNHFYTESTKVRRQNRQVQLLVKMIGRNLRLYDELLHTIRCEYLNSKSPHVCSLRAEILMTLHDEEISELMGMDPCHKFAWCLDACNRERHIDSRQAKELLAVLDQVNKEEAEVLGDIAMIAADPHILHFLGLLVLKLLNSLFQSDGLPRENNSLPLLLRLISLGLSSHGMFDNEHFVEKDLDGSVITSFLSRLMLLFRDDAARQLLDSCPDDKLPEGVTQAEANAFSNATSVSEEMITMARSDAVCGFLLWQYVIDVTHKRDRAAVLRMLPHFLAMQGRLVAFCAFEPTYLVPFVTASVQFNGESFANEDFCRSVFEKFLLCRIDGAPVVSVKTPTSVAGTADKQLLLEAANSEAPTIFNHHIRWTQAVRLAKHVGNKIPVTYLKSLSDLLAPPNFATPEELTVYQAMIEKFEAATAMKSPKMLDDAQSPTAAFMSPPTALELTSTMSSSMTSPTSPTTSLSSSSSSSSSVATAMNVFEKK